MNISIKTKQDDFIEVHNVANITEEYIANDRILHCIGEYVETENEYALSIEVNGCIPSRYNRYFNIRCESCDYIKIY